MFSNHSTAGCLKDVDSNHAELSCLGRPRAWWLTYCLNKESDYDAMLQAILLQISRFREDQHSAMNLKR